MRLRGLLLASTLLVACSSPGTTTTISPSTLRFDLAADPTTLNPLFEHPDVASVEQQVARLAFEPFVDLDANGRPEPALLAVIPTVANGGISRDGQTIVYRLRSNVRWSDGVAVTSDDVLFTLHAILDSHNPVRSREGYDLIDHAYARDARTVVFHLKHAWAPAVATLFSYGTSAQFALPAHVLRTQMPLARAPFNGAPLVGDGPYTFVAWHRGESLRYVANPHYWRGTPSIPTLDIRIVPEPSTNLVMLESGILDWNLIAPVQRTAVATNATLAFRATPTAVVAGLALNTTHAPLDDVRVRRALAMSIDRVAISQKITLGAYPVTDTLQPRFSWAFDPSVRESSFNPAAADAAFDAAGWRRDRDGMRRKNGVAFHLVYVQFPESMTGTRVAATVQAALHARGIDVTIKSVSNAQLFLPGSHGTLASGNFDLAYVPWTMGADPDDSFVLACRASGNYMRWCNRDVDALEHQALQATEIPKRRAIYAKIAHIVAAQVPVIYLFNARYVYAYRTRLHGFTPNAFLPTWNAWQWRFGRS